MKLTFIKTISGLFAPYGEDSQTAMARVKPGQLLQGDFTKPRNPDFHRKVFALLGLLFDIWAETCPTQEYKGVHVLPEFERFRKDLTIMAGFYRPVWNIKGELRLEAESLSFGSMTQERFEQAFSAYINVGLAKILKPGAMTEQQLRNRVDQLLAFDGG